MLTSLIKRFSAYLQRIPSTGGAYLATRGLHVSETVPRMYYLPFHRKFHIMLLSTLTYATASFVGHHAKQTGKTKSSLSASNEVSKMRIFPLRVSLYSEAGSTTVVV